MRTHYVNELVHETRKMRTALKKHDMKEVYSLTILRYSLVDCKAAVEGLFNGSLREK